MSRYNTLKKITKRKLFSQAIDYFLSRIFWLLAGTAFGYLWAFKALEGL